jgi:hypothetical protein
MTHRLLQRSTASPSSRTKRSDLREIPASMTIGPRQLALDIPSFKTLHNGAIAAAPIR